MDFPIGHLLDEGACYDFLVGLLHPDGLACPRCGSHELRVHRRTRDPVVDYRCPDCRRAPTVAAQTPSLSRTCERWNCNSYQCRR